MYYTLTTLSTAAVSICPLAHPSASQPAAISNPLTKRYIPGWCGVHVKQYQKNEGPVGSDGGTSEYRLDVNLYDDIQDPIGSVSLLSIAGAFIRQSVVSFRMRLRCWLEAPTSNLCFFSTMGRRGIVMVRRSAGVGSIAEGLVKSTVGSTARSSRE